jgi:O-antigen/teichoic acid export membrane protein
MGPAVTATGTLRRVGRNAASILASDVLNRAATFVVYALVARHLGTFQFGQLSLALTLFYTFQVLAVAGLKTLITREVAKDNTRTDAYLVHGSLVVALASALSIGTLGLYARSMNYSADTTSIILLLSLGLIPYSLSAVCEGVIQAWERMHYVAVANLPVNIAKVALAFLMLSRAHGLFHVVILLVACHGAVAVIEWWLVLRRICRPQPRVEFGFLVGTIRSTSTFLGINGSMAAMASINILLLSAFVSEAGVGMYSAAGQLLVPANLVCQSVALSLFPMMCRRFEPRSGRLTPLAERAMEMLFAIGLAMAVGLFLLADPALRFLYGNDEFVLASGALRIMAGTAIVGALTSVLGQLLVAGGWERVTLRIVVIDAVAILGFGVLLIPRYGLLGAATSALLMGLVDLWQHYLAVWRLLFRIPLGRLVVRPLVAGMCMAGSLVLMGRDALVLAVACGGVVYAGVLVALTVWSLGGPRQVRAKYLYGWGE